MPKTLYTILLVLNINIIKLTKIVSFTVRKNKEFLKVGYFNVAFLYVCI